MSDFFYIDTHAHLDMLKKRSPESSVSESMEENVRYIINIGTDLDGCRKSLEYAEKFDNVFGSLGVHPHDAENFNNETVKSIIEMYSGFEKRDKIVAIGETGFDYYRNLSSKKAQEIAFRSQIEIAMEYGLPVVVHSREADEDMLKLLSEYADEERFRAVVHCFSGPPSFAEKILELGLFISFTGVITFPNAKKVREAVKVVPMERMFIETDSPFLAPQEHRGKENHPGFVKYVAQKISEIKEIKLEEVAEATSKNAIEFFKLK